MILVLSLAVSAVAVAEEYRYLVPLAGYIATSDGTYHYATTVLQNLSPRTATVRASDAYPLNPGRPCSTGGEPFTIAAQSRRTISPMSCMAAASALEIVSSEKLIVRMELDTHKTRVLGWDKQVIDAPTAWIPAGVTAVTEAVIRFDGPRTANLLVVNPSAETLTMTVDMSRPEIRMSSTTTIQVPPHSMRMVPLEEVRNPNPPPFIYSLEGRHLLRLTANGPWQGGVSSLYEGPSMYMPATPLVP